MNPWRTLRQGVVLVAALLVAGCDDDGGGGVPTCTNPGECVQPEIWLELTGFGAGQSIAAHETTAYVAGHGGLVAVNLRNGTTRVLPLPTLDGRTVSVVRAPSSGVLAIGVPASEFLSALLLISEDGGATWRDATPPDAGPSALQRESLAFVPGPEANGSGLLFANIGCDGLSLSADLGGTWTTLTPPSDLCVESPIAASGDGRTLWHGTEFGFDIVVINNRDISARANTPPGPWTVVVEGPDLLSNHDPNVIVADPQDGESVYIGAELSVMHLSGPQDFEYRIGSVESEDFPYFRGFWFDPTSPDHLLAGGGFNGGSAALYESFEGGFEAVPVPLPELPEEIEGGIIQGIVPVPGTRDIVCLATTNFRNDPADGRTFLLRGTVNLPR